VARRTQRGESSGGAAPRAHFFRPARDIAWSVEQQGVAIVRRGGSLALLRYPEAAVWELLSRRAPRKRMIRLTAALLNGDAADARAFVDSALMRWLHRGWIEASVQRRT
jgi:hypothetical protein